MIKILFWGSINCLLVPAFVPIWFVIFSLLNWGWPSDFAKGWMFGYLLIIGQAHLVRWAERRWPPQS